MIDQITFSVGKEKPLVSTLAPPLAPPLHIEFFQFSKVLKQHLLTICSLNLKNIEWLNLSIEKNLFKGFMIFPIVS